MNTLSVTVRILRATEETDFAAIPGMASENDLLYGPAGQSQGVDINGLTSVMTIRAIANTEVDASPLVWLKGEADPQNVVWLKYDDLATAG